MHYCELCCWQKFGDIFRLSSKLNFLTLNNAKLLKHRIIWFIQWLLPKSFMLFLAPSATTIHMVATLDSSENVINTIFHPNVYKLVFVPYGQKQKEIFEQFFLESNWHNLFFISIDIWLRFVFLFRFCREITQRIWFICQ